MPTVEKIITADQKIAILTRYMEKMQRELVDAEGKRKEALVEMIWRSHKRLEELRALH